MAIVIYSQSFCQKSVKRKSPKKYIFFVFRFDVRPGIRNRALHLISPLAAKLRRLLFTRTRKTKTIPANTNSITAAFNISFASDV